MEIILSKLAVLLDSFNGDKIMKTQTVDLSGFNVALITYCIGYITTGSFKGRGNQYIPDCQDSEL